MPPEAITLKKYFINFIEGVIPHVSEAPFHEYVITINKLCVASAHVEPDMCNISFPAVLLYRTKCPLFNYPKLIYFYCPRSSYYQKQQKNIFPKICSVLLIGRPKSGEIVCCYHINK